MGFTKKAKNIIMPSVEIGYSAIKAKKGEDMAVRYVLYVLYVLYMIYVRCYTQNFSKPKTNSERISK